MHQKSTEKFYSVVSGLTFLALCFGSKCFYELAQFVIHFCYSPTTCGLVGISLTTGSGAWADLHFSVSYPLLPERNLSYCLNSGQRKKPQRQRGSSCSQAAATRLTFLVFRPVNVISESDVSSWHDKFKSAIAEQTAQLGDGIRRRHYETYGV